MKPSLYKSQQMPVDHSGKDKDYTMREFDLIPLRQKKFVQNQVVTKSTGIKNTKYWLNNLFLKQLMEPYINYVKPQLKSI